MYGSSYCAIQQAGAGACRMRNVGVGVPKLLAFLGFIDLLFADAIIASSKNFVALGSCLGTGPVSQCC